MGSPPKPGFGSNSLAPFPGPGARLGQPAVSPDPVFSPQDSSSDGEHRSPSPSVRPLQNGRNTNNGSHFPGSGVRENGNHNRQVSSESASSPYGGINRFAGCSQTPQKVEVFHGSLAAHLSTILLSEDEKAVVASAQ